MTISGKKPVKNNVEGERNMSGTKPVYVQLLAWISGMNTAFPEGGIFTVSQISAMLNEKHAEGYDVFATHYLGRAPEGNSYGVMYIFRLRRLRDA